MDNGNLEETETAANNGNIYDEKPTCLLDENDTQCGHVFYNEFTRLLKFFCTYCQETYDNIEYFCQHLSEHIKDIKTENYKEDDEAEEEFLEELVDSGTNSLIITPANEALERLSSHSNALTDDDTRDAFEYEETIKTENSQQDFSCNLSAVDNVVNDVEMLIEEIEDTDKIRDDEEEEMHESVMKDENKYLWLDYENNFQTAVTTTTTPGDNIKSANSFEDCFIKETNIDKIRTEGVCVLKEKNLKGRKPIQRRKSNIPDLLRLKRRRKKVTTVKVIAVKNRIAELYERIQNEQQKSQKIFSNDFVNVHQEQETQDAIESLINNTEGDIDKKFPNLVTDDIKTQTSSEVTRKIIGETVITLIPEGTKIPNKLPSPIHKPTNNESLQVMSSSTSYKYYRSEDTKEKLAVCPACGKIFRSHFSLTIHKRIHYLESDSSVKLAHKCSDCDQLFNKLSQLKHHVETVHYPDGFICKICNRQLSSLSLLERHMVKVHLDRPFNCKKCNKNFSDPLTFEEHQASHNSGEVFKCSTCGRKYTTEFFLMEHMRNHKEQVPQTCVVCGKVTLRITQHMKIHTPRPKRLLSCSVCGKVFNFSSGLSHHFKIMHKLPRPPPKPKKETQGTSVKRKRRSRANNEHTANKKKLSNPVSMFAIDSDKFPDQIIEEQIEIPHEVYDTATPSSLLNLETKENHVSAHSSNQTYNIPDKAQQLHQIVQHELLEDEVLNHKEEEAKRVIVELIQNSTYTSFFPDNFSSVLEVTPPIAREETISAVNSIVHEC